MILPLYLYGQPVLRKEAEEIGRRRRFGALLPVDSFDHCRQRVGVGRDDGGVNLRDVMCLFLSCGGDAA